MRNKTKAATPFRWMLRRYVFLAVLALVITFVVFPMQGIVRIISVSDFLKSPGAILDLEMRYAYMRELTYTFIYSPLNLETICALFGGLGFAAAMVLFRHLFSRNQGMMYAALPLRREHDFGVRVGVYAVWCLLPMALCLMVHPLMIRVYGLEDLFVFSLYLRRAGVTLLINLYGFALGALCASLFGTIWSAALGGILLAGSGELAVYCWIEIASCYLATMHTKTIRSAALRFSPIYSLYKAFYLPDRYGILPGLLAILLFMGLALLARKHLLPENAGHTLNRKKLEPALLFWTAVLGGTAGAIVMMLYLDREAFLFLGLILGAAVMWLLIRMLLDQRVRLSFAGWKMPAAALCCMLVALLGLRADVFGYNRYAPKAADLRAVRVWNGYSGEEIVFESPEAVEASLAWTAEMTAEMEEERLKGAYQRGYCDIVVNYEGRNGRLVTRSYHLPNGNIGVLPYLRVMAREMEQHRAAQVPELSRAHVYRSLPDFGIPAAEFQETFGFQMEVQRQPKAEELREALRQDLAARTLETLQEPTLVTVYFEGNAEPSMAGEGSYRNISYDIKPSDHHTLSLLLGADAVKWIDYAAGGFARSGEIAVFRCDYSLDEENMWQMDSYRMAENEQEVRQWMKQVTQCSDSMFSFPTDEMKQIAVYSRAQIRDSWNYQELDLDLEDPEVIRNLPACEDVWRSRGWDMVIPEEGSV